MIIFLIEIAFIYFISRRFISDFYFASKRILRKDSYAYWAISVIMLPGTIVHELSHFLTAVILFLPVRSMSILPEFEKGQLKLGEVLYEKKDFLRSILVGISPMIFGTLIIFLTFYYKIFPGSNTFLNVLIFFLIFSVSSNMFSSKQDLSDLIYLIPVVIIIIISLYLFGIKISVDTFNNTRTSFFNDIINKVDIYLFYVLIINLSGYVLLKLFNKIIKPI